MNAFEAQNQVGTGFVQLTKPCGETFRFIIYNGQVEALTLNGLPLEEGDERGPSHEDLSAKCWEAFHACNLNSNQGVPVWFTGFRKAVKLSDNRSETGGKERRALGYGRITIL